jgi:hypothetical protein
VTWDKNSTTGVVMNRDLQALAQYDREKSRALELAESRRQVADLALAVRSLQDTVERMTGAQPG